MFNTSFNKMQGLYINEYSASVGSTCNVVGKCEA